MQSTSLNIFLDLEMSQIPRLHQPKSHNRFNLGHHRFKFCVGVNRSIGHDRIHFGHHQIQKSEFKKANLKMTFIILFSNEFE